MCGIVGYVGGREAEPILVDGLRRLEYRGYDSAGVATLTGAASAPPQEGRPHRRTRAATCANGPPPAAVGISHTRWATHGPRHRPQRPPARRRRRRRSPSSTTASSRTTPPSSGNSQAEGVVFHSETDTEVIAHLIAAASATDDLVDAVRQRPRACSRAPTAWPSSARSIPDVIVGARLGSPLVVGVGDGEHFLASDPAALVGHTEQVVYLQDHQMCVLTRRRLARARRRPRRASTRQPVHQHRLGAGRRRQGRLRALHAQGDLRAARGARERHARPARRRRRHGPLRRPEPRRRSSCARSSGSS